jgi:UDP-N-acetylglucosamine enolpyruvyl transferase
MNWIKKLLGSKDTPTTGERDAFIAAQEAITSPWACFEVVGFEEGRVKVEFNWNQAFIDELDKLGFTAETQEDTVQLFFYASQMKPTSVETSGDPSVQSSDLPNLSANTNQVRR